MTSAALKRFPVGGFLAGLLVFSLVWFLLLAPSLFSSESLFAGDAPGLKPSEHPGLLGHHFYGSWHYNNGGLGEGVGATTWSPLRWMRDLVTFSGKHQELTYFIATLLTFLGMLYYLGGLLIPMAQRIAPSLAYTFAGYSFGLIAGGHNGFFQMTAYVIWLFAVLHRAVERGSLLHYAWAGALVIWGVGVQPDMMIPLSIVAAFYGLTLLVSKWRRTGGPDRRKLLSRTGIGLAIMFLFFGLFGIGAFRFLFETVIPTRDIEAGQTPSQRWEFMTNWSMPVEETPEFIVPNLYGIDSETPETPYWGALGRPLNWERNINILKNNLSVAPADQKPAIQRQLQQYRRSVNLRQHSMYLGVVPVVFALFALGLSFFARGPDWEWTRDRGVSWRTLVWFWMAVALIGLIFCYGRNLFDGALYRIPYSLPFLDKIRAPVKYVRLLEIGLAFASAIGLALAMARLRVFAAKPEPVKEAPPEPAASESNPSMTSTKQAKNKKGKSKSKQAPKQKQKQKPKQKAKPAAAPALKKPTHTRGTRAFLIAFGICAAIALLLLLSALASQFGAVGFERKLRPLGFADKADALRSQIFLSYFQSTILFGALAAFFGLSFFKPRLKVLKWTPWILVALVALDVYIVNNRLLRTRDKAAWHAENPVAEMITSTPGRWQTDNLVVPFNKLNPISYNWVYNGVYNLRPGRGAKADTQDFFRALQSNPKRLWDLTGTRYIIAQRGQARSLTALPGISEASAIQLNPADQTWNKTDAPTSPMVLLENADARPYATLHYQWSATSGTNDYARIAAPTWDMDRELLVDVATKPPTAAIVASNRVATAVDLASLDHSPTHITLDVANDQEAILLLQEKFHPDVNVTVNGKSADLLRANGILRGVHLPPGNHTVAFTYRPYTMPLLISLVGTGALVLWSLGSALGLSRRRRATSTAAPESA